MRVEDLAKEAARIYEFQDGARKIPSRVGRCASFLHPRADVAALTPLDAASVLKGLRGDGLAIASQREYYRAFKQLARLAGADVSRWPAAPKQPRRRRREAFPDAKLEPCLTWLEARGWHETADLAWLIRRLGLRPDVEALRPAAWSISLRRGEGYDVLNVTGKGGHERAIPLVDADLRELVRDDRRLRRIWSCPYRTHAWRWKQAVDAIGVDTRLPSLHSLRHAFGTAARNKAGIEAASQLLGHADLRTTQAYMDAIDVNELTGAV